MQANRIPQPDTSTLLAAAMKVLADSTYPLSCFEMIQLMATHGTCLPGRTPEHTLYATLVQYMAQQGAFCPVHKTERGCFLLVRRAR